MKKTWDEITIGELNRLYDEYERMLSIARDNNWLSQEFRLQEKIENLSSYIIVRVGKEG
jgi:hypothetical protein